MSGLSPVGRMWTVCVRGRCVCVCIKHFVRVKQSSERNAHKSESHPLSPTLPRRLPLLVSNSSPVLVTARRSAPSIPCCCCGFSTISTPLLLLRLLLHLRRCCSSISPLKACCCFIASPTCSGGSKAGLQEEWLQWELLRSPQAQLPAQVQHKHN